MANTRVSDLASGGAFANTDLFYVVETAGVGGVQKTGAQLVEFIQDTMNATLVGGSNISVTYNDPANTITIAYTGAPPPADTDDLPEGATNLYFTDARAIAAVGPVAEALTANRTYYVRTDGSDSNTGLVDSAGGAFLTIQKGIDTAATLLLNGFTVTIQVRDGTFVGDVSLKSITGGRVIVQGNTTTPTNVVIQRSAAIAAVLGIGIVGTYTFQGFTFAGTPGAWIRVDGPGVNFTFNTITFPLLTAGIHILSLNGAIVQSDGNYTISGGGATFMQTSVQGMIVDLAARTITVSGTPAWSFGFAVASANSTIRYPNKTYSGAATGVRYRVSENSVISVGGSATYFPGDVAGVITTGGQYV